MFFVCLFIKTEFNLNHTFKLYKKYIFISKWTPLKPDPKLIKPWLTNPKSESKIRIQNLNPKNEPKIMIQNKTQIRFQNQIYHNENRSSVWWKNWSFFRLSFVSFLTNWLNLIKSQTEFNFLLLFGCSMNLKQNKTLV